MIKMPNGRPRKWVKKHRYDIIRAARTGGFMAGLAGGTIGAIMIRPMAIPIWAAGTIGGTFAGEALGIKLTKTLKKVLPKRTKYKMPKLPTAGQVIIAPIAIPFKIGEAYGQAIIKRRQAIKTRKLIIPPTTKGNPFIPKKNIFMR